MLKELKWQPLKDRRIDQRLVFFHKIIYELVAVPADNLLMSTNANNETLTLNPSNWQQVTLTFTKTLLFHVLFGTETRYQTV
ncbi:hypothetical protein DPMN_046471 [Dreissena polymorpha]|uniref:Uncharacterized protein n=1 Tax=Dreissena polymorpha TaxID=45954 RepID=A0A9D4D683_DREPO|nr:hypothetical protein DPMN_046471 [Dreissena polymorpha]